MKVMIQEDFSVLQIPSRQFMIGIIYFISKCLMKQYQSICLILTCCKSDFYQDYLFMLQRKKKNFRISDDHIYSIIFYLAQFKILSSIRMPIYVQLIRTKQKNKKKVKNRRTLREAASACVCVCVCECASVSYYVLSTL